MNHHFDPLETPNESDHLGTGISRVVTAPIEIDGRRLGEGDTVMLLLAAANRDPLAYADPDVLDITRKGVRNHLAFGMGSHFCLGSPLARMEAIVAFGALSSRFPHLRIADMPLSWSGHAKLRGLSSLPVFLHG